MEIISAIFGFFAPFATEIFKFWQRKQDNEHEIKMMELQLNAANQQHLWRMEEIITAGDIQESTNLHKPQHSFGVQLLDAAKGHNLNGWALYPAFYAFILLDFISSLVRPSITYAAFLFYAAVKWAQLQSALTIGSGKYSEALLAVWTSTDMSIVILVLSYWFGQRAAKAAFGGSSNTAYRGG